MSESLRDLRVNAGKSVKETATALNVTLRAVFNYEYGLRRISLEQILILSALFDCSEREVIDAALNSLRNPKCNLDRSPKSDIS